MNRPSDSCRSTKMFLWGKEICGNELGHCGLHITWDGKYSWRNKKKEIILDFDKVKNLLAFQKMESVVIYLYSLFQEENGYKEEYSDPLNEAIDLIQERQAIV